MGGTSTAKEWYSWKALMAFGHHTCQPLHANTVDTVKAKRNQYRAQSHCRDLYPIQQERLLSAGFSSNESNG